MMQNNNCIKLDIANKLIRIPKLKDGIKLKLHTIPRKDFKIKQVIITMSKMSKFFVSLSAEEQIEIKEKQSKSIGIDIGIKDFLTLSNGVKIANPKIAKQFENRIIREQRRLSRKINSLKNKEKQRILFAKKSYRLNERLNNIKKDFLHKLSNQISNDYDTICLETLNIKEMIKNHNLAPKTFS